MPEDPGQHHAQLLERCRGGDQRAWAELVQELGPLVFAVARRVGLAEDQCEDAAQATFAALASKLGTIREPEALPGWLATTARREAIRLSRAAAKRQGTPLAGDPQAADGGPDLEALETHHRLRTALDQLGPACRNLLRALYFEGSTPDYRGVAERLGVAVGSIGPTRQRCLAKLAEIFAGRP
ncbi:MAG: RNA polymerase sigma factor [Phycisphaerales bacterium JB060]